MAALVRASLASCSAVAAAVAPTAARAAAASAAGAALTASAGAAASPRSARYGSLFALPPPPAGALRGLHTSAPAESATLAAAGVGIATAAIAARYALNAYAKANASEGGSGDKAEKVEGGASSSSEGGEASAKKPASSSASSAGSGFLSAQSMARRFYKGGFEDKMTRREASLILGVRCVAAR
jgi:hypothetical protein